MHQKGVWYYNKKLSAYVEGRIYTLAISETMTSWLNEYYLVEIFRMFKCNSSALKLHAAIYQYIKIIVVPLVNLTSYLVICINQ
jgi:hypothetical protein